MKSFENYADPAKLAENKEKREKERREKEEGRLSEGVSAALSENLEFQEKMQEIAGDSVAKDRELTKAKWVARGEKRELKEASITDPLTGLHNRRGFEDFINAKQRAIRKEAAILQEKKGVTEEKEKSSNTFDVKLDELKLQEKENVTEKREKLFSVFIIDLDRFKSINDTYGHDAGDEVLQKVATVLKKNLRGSKDMVARWGGEEFIVATENSPRISAVEIAERLRQAIENIELYYREKVPVTASIGVSPYHDNFGDMCKTADTALYIAKGAAEKVEKENLRINGKVPTEEESRNQVWYFDPESEEFSRYYSESALREMEN